VVPAKQIRKTRMNLVGRRTIETDSGASPSPA